MTPAEWEKVPGTVPRLIIECPESPYGQRVGRGGSAVPKSTYPGAAQKGGEMTFADALANMIPCVSCGYQSKRGNRHFDNCRLMMLAWISKGGPEKEGFPMKPLTGNEIVELAMLEDQMKERGAKPDADGYFGKCVVKG